MILAISSKKELANVLLLFVFKNLIGYSPSLIIVDIIFLSILNVA